MWISKDAYGLVQLWNNKPQIFKDSCNKITFGSHTEIGVEVNDILELRNIISLEKSPLFLNISYRNSNDCGGDINIDDNALYN